MDPVVGSTLPAHRVPTLPDVTESAMRKSGFPDEDPATMIQPEQIANAAVYQATESATAYTMVMHVHNGMQVRNLK